jgi:hypothetical protein
MPQWRISSMTEDGSIISVFLLFHISTEGGHTFLSLLHYLPFLLSSYSLTTRRAMPGHANTHNTFGRPRRKNSRGHKILDKAQSLRYYVGRSHTGFDRHIPCHIIAKSDIEHIHARSFCIC